MSFLWRCQPHNHRQHQHTEHKTQAQSKLKTFHSFPSFQQSCKCCNSQAGAWLSKPQSASLSSCARLCSLVGRNSQSAFGLRFLLFSLLVLPPTALIAGKGFEPVDPKSSHRGAWLPAAVAGEPRRLRLLCLWLIRPPSFFVQIAPGLPGIITPESAHPKRSSKLGTGSASFLFSFALAPSTAASGSEASQKAESSPSDKLPAGAGAAIEAHQRGLPQTDISLRAVSLKPGSVTSLSRLTADFLPSTKQIDKLILKLT